MPECAIVSMTFFWASMKMTIGGTSMKTAAAIATPCTGKTGAAACCNDGREGLEGFAVDQCTALNIPRRLKGEDHHGHQGGLLVRHDDLPADREHIRAVHLGGLDHRIRYGGHGLAHQEQAHRDATDGRISAQ